MKKEMELILIVILISVNIVSAEHIATTQDGGNSFQVFEADAFQYQINITNTGLTQNSNIIQVNITIPTILKFTGNTQTTNAFFQSFVNTSDTLSWTNFANSLINASEQKYFKFVANATLEGLYTIIITTLNSTGEYSSNISLEVIETTCTPNWGCSAWSVCKNNSQTRNCTDFKSCGNEFGKPAENQSCSTNQTTSNLCIQNWTCTKWSGCIGGTQMRICTDSNLCGNEFGKPAESQNCQGNKICTPVYECTDWQPKKCDKKGLQTRTCTDSNNCGTSKDKPNESRTCKANSELLFIILVIIIITLLIFDGIILMLVLKREKEELEKKNKQKNLRR